MITVWNQDTIIRDFCLKIDEKYSFKDDDWKCANEQFLKILLKLEEMIFFWFFFRRMLNQKIKI